MKDKITFKADPTISRDLYLHTRSRYTQFKAGIFFIIVLLGGIAYDIYNQYLWLNYGCGWQNILIHVAVGAVFIGLAVASVFYMLSGGKAELIRTDRETLSLYDDHLVVTYRYAKGKYRLGRRIIYLCDIAGMDYDDDKKRISVHADCRIQKTKGNSFKNGDEVETVEKEGAITYIYARYDDFEELVKKLEEKSLKKVRSDSVLY